MLPQAWLHPIAAMAWLFGGSGFSFPLEIKLQGNLPPEIQETNVVPPRPQTPRVTQSQIPQTGKPDVAQMLPAVQSPGSLAKLFKKVDPGAVSTLDR